MAERARRERAGPAVPVGGGVPVDPETGERFGYLPRRAAQRKIIIRRKLGLPWVVGALAAAVLIAAVGVAFVLSQPGRPPARYADEGPLTAYPAGQVTALRSGRGWVDRRDGVAVRITREPFCDSDGGWGAGPARWDAAGGAHGGGSNLALAPTQLAGGKLYVDAARARPGRTVLPVRLAACARPRPLSS